MEKLRKFVYNYYLQHTLSEQESWVFCGIKDQIYPGDLGYLLNCYSQKLISRFFSIVLGANFVTDLRCNGMRYFFPIQKKMRSNSHSKFKRTVKCRCKITAKLIKYPHNSNMLHIHHRIRCEEQKSRDEA